MEISSIEPFRKLVRDLETSSHICSGYSFGFIPIPDIMLYNIREQLGGDKVSKGEEIFEELKEKLLPLLNFIGELDNPHHSEVCARYSTIYIARELPLTTAVGILELVKSEILNPKNQNMARARAKMTLI